MAQYQTIDSYFLPQNWGNPWQPSAAVAGNTLTAPRMVTSTGELAIIPYSDNSKE